MTSRAQSMKRQVYIATFILLLLVTVIALVVRMDSKSPGISPASQAPVKTLRIQRPEFPDIAMTLSEGQWLITEPCELPANPQRLQPLLDVLTADAHQYDAAEVDLDAAGLLHPEAVVILGETRIEIGNTDLQGQRRYIKRGDAVQLAPEWILSLVNGGLSAMASSALFKTPITALSLITDTGPVDLDQHDIQQWQALSANQILSWPISEPETPLATRVLKLHDSDGQSTFSVNTYPRYSALHIDNAGCAYILATDSLPPLSEP